MNKVVFTLIVFVMCVAPLVAPAEDLQAPWWRGEWSTTSQYWEFSIDDPGDPLGAGLAPDGSPVGGQPWLPSTMLWVTPGPGMGWLEEDKVYDYELPDGRTGTVGIGVWELSGAIEVVVDNHDPNPDNEKWIWVQITWRPQIEGAVLEFWNLSPLPIYDPRIVEEILFDPTDPLGWRETTYEWKLDWNPMDEWFTFGGDINVDELVVDTWCVPEPGIFAIMGLGLVTLLGLRRKK